MKKIIIFILCIIIVLLCGCAKWSNEIAANGGLIGSYNGNYIVRNDSGGRIMDVWVLSDCMVQSDAHGAGWMFRDKSGNVIHLGGDVKVMRLKDLSAVSEYHEYHAEFEKKTYQELYPQTK